MSAQGDVLVGVVTSLLPYLVLIEQSDGLYTHHRPLYRSLLGRLSALPYYVYVASVDAHLGFGASHYRSRLLMVLVRSDLHV